MLEYDRELQRKVRREKRRRKIRRERMIGAGTAAAVVLGGAALFSLHNPATSSTAATIHHRPPAPPHLPRGGRTILPRFRVVAFDGAPQDPGLGALGVGSPRQATSRLLAQAARYARPGHPVLPAMELIATVVQADPGLDSLYRMRQSRAVINRYLRAARRARALLVLDIQPGRASFVSELRAYRRWLRLPDVGLALDPEWSVRAPNRPGQEIGSTDATAVNRVAAAMSRIVRAGNLPQKLLIVHRFTTGMVAHADKLRTYPGVATVLNTDGYGTRADKATRYEQLAKRTPGIANGFKLFYHEDTGLMTPRQVLKLRPAPEVVVYE
jgi:hypothetical protein